MNRRVLTGLSGGVDSAVTAILLKEQGYEVFGCSIDFHGRPDADAAKVAETLGIPFCTADARARFSECVIGNFLSEYAAGRTPNPCVQCNPNVKFRTLLVEADRLGCDWIATGHYASVVTLPNGRLSLRMADAAGRDQTYALYRLPQEVLRRLVLPLGAYSKDEVRAIAEAHSLTVAHKHDSQEICFIPDDDHLRFLDERLPEGSVRPGAFVDDTGRVLGRHEGLPHYTIGQRKGLNLSMGHPVYVTALRPETNEVLIGENADLFSRKVFAKDVSFMGLRGFDDKAFIGDSSREAFAGDPGREAFADASDAGRTAASCGT
ncbi:MAG: tRNA 2-thiouridine(34) synthase MnmA, partial [Lachnospiraceae bacterium]|nr:tRNA 2-thiouridine(34) synthase MnmA [Lachnospiraceae bacterium]